MRLDRRATCGCIVPVVAAQVVLLVASLSVLASIMLSMSVITKRPRHVLYTEMHVDRSGFD
jgi:hypothetical protein